MKKVPNREQLVSSNEGSVEESHDGEATTTGTKKVVWPFKWGIARQRPILERCAAYVCSAIVILSSNTLPGDSIHGLLSAFVWVTLVVFTTLMWRGGRIVRGTLRACLAWMAVVVTGWLAVGITMGSLGGGTITIFVLTVAMTPFFFCLLKERDAQSEWLRAYVNVMVFLAAASLLLWLIGPFSGLIQQSGLRDSGWTGMPRECRNYYGLLYVTQYMLIAGHEVPRNTGIFTEAPMYALSLSIALTIELYAFKKPRWPYVFLLVVCMVTTFSTAGYVVILVHGMFLLWRWGYSGRHMRITGWYKAAFYALIAICAMAIAVVGIGRITSSSGNIRTDDFRAGWLAWLESPLFGSGFSITPIKAHMSEFRLSDPGFSNSPMYLLALGGLAFALPVVFGIMSPIVFGRGEQRLAGLVLALLWVITVVAFLPLTALFIGWGVSTWANNAASEEDMRLSLTDFFGCVVWENKICMVVPLACAALAAVWFCTGGTVYSSVADVHVQTQGDRLELNQVLWNVNTLLAPVEQEARHTGDCLRIGSDAKYNSSSIEIWADARKANVAQASAKLCANSVAILLPEEFDVAKVVVRKAESKSFDVGWKCATGSLIAGFAGAAAYSVAKRRQGYDDRKNGTGLSYG